MSKIVTVLLALSTFGADESPTSTLDRAYYRELAFLKAQRAEMAERARAAEVEAEEQLRTAQTELDERSSTLLGLRRRAEALEEELRQSPPPSKESIAFVFEAVDRAKELVEGFEPKSAPRSKDPPPSPDSLAAALREVFAAIEDQLRIGHRIETRPGSFFGANGEKIDGEIVHVGRVAAFGVSGDHAGVLAPGGGGETRLLALPAGDKAGAALGVNAEETARALANHEVPRSFSAFLLDAFDVRIAEEKSADIAWKPQTAGLGSAGGDHGIVGALMGLPIFHAEWVLYLLILLSVVSVGIMAERALFYRRHAVNVEDVRKALKMHLARGDFHGAAELLSAHDSFETNVVLFGLREHETGPDSVEDLIRGAEAKEKLRYNRWLSFLATVGSNAPFIGLFGTVLGIIRAFADLSGDMGGAGSSVMAGISEALIATAVGLLVAIPAVIAYNAFSGRVKTAMANAELLSRTLLSQLKAHEPHGPRMG